MKIFTCKDRLEDIMTCIYDAWSEALLIGHDQIQLKKEPIFWKIQDIGSFLHKI